MNKKNNFFIIAFLISLTIFCFMEKTTDTGKSVNLPIPGALIQRIRALQPKVGASLGFRTKATQYHVISEAIGLLEKKVVK